MTPRNELFSKHDSQNWTFFFWIWLTELNSFLLNTTQQIEPFFYWLKDLYFFNVIQRVFFTNMTLSKFNPFWKKWLKNWTFFEKAMIHRIEPFLLIWLTEWNPSFQFDSKNWTLFKILLKELNPCQHVTRRIEPFFKILLKELNPFQHVTRRIEHFFQ